MLSFLPAGLPRSAAEHLVSALAGSILLFAFFILAEIAMVAVKEDLLAMVFVPVICIMPILSGAASALVLEKLRRRPLSMKNGVLVGAAAGFFGALLAGFALTAVSLLLKQSPFGGFVKDWLVYVLLLVTLFIDTLFGALGGVLVVKFIKQ
jgi:hypothetical protein